MRKRKIRKIGNSYYVKLEQTDMKDLNLEVGDMVEITTSFLKSKNNSQQHQKINACSLCDGEEVVKNATNPADVSFNLKTTELSK